MLSWRSRGKRHFAGLDILVDAQYHAAQGQTYRAAELFEQAVQALETSEFLLLRATAHECTGRFLAGRGQLLTAEVILTRACDLYRLWGGTQKVARLRQEFPAIAQERDLDTMPTLVSNTLTRTKSATINRTKTGDGRLTDVEMQPLRRLAQALSGKLTLEVLASTSLAALLESTSASRAILQMEPGGANARIFDTHPGRIRPDSLIALTARSREIFCIDDTAPHPELLADIYVAEARPRAMLCMPALHNQEVQGVIYLENDTTPGIFTAARVRLLELLGPQIAMAFENRSLLGAMEQRVMAQTEQLRAASAKLVLQEKQQTETQMAGGFAHEMRNALGSIGYILPSLVLSPNFPNSADTPLVDLVQTHLA